MGSFFSRLFGGLSSKDEGSKRSEPVPYEGFLICAAPQKNGDKWNLAGVIIKPGEDGEEDLEREFIRADTFTSRDEAVSFAMSKGEQIINEQGARLFADGGKTGRA
ncbi:MAG: transcriptional activator HlyU [Rhodospirillales bacterium]|nr:transcriptional activator HlyU [Rhodospirillales bacterium]